MYQEKYLKYKAKYLKLKNLLQGGGLEILEYLGQGADNIAFKLKDGKVIRIMKNCGKLEETERTILTELTGKAPKYFVRIYLVGKCTDLRDKISKDMKTFCDAIGENMCEYNYVILDRAYGTNYSNFFFAQFKDLILADDFDEQITRPDVIAKINDFAEKSKNYIIKIIEGLTDANVKLNGFRHGDFNYRNCFIDDEFNPTIFDFGGSSINNTVTPESSDIFNYLKQIITDVEVGSAVYEHSLPTWDDMESAKKSQIKKNFMKLRNQFRTHPKINGIIQNYFTSLPHPDGGIKVFPKDTNNSVTLRQLYDFINA